MNADDLEAAFDEESDEDPSDLPSIDPSDIPSIDPSDLPSLSEEQQSQLDDLLSDAPAQE